MTDCGSGSFTSMLAGALWVQDNVLLWLGMLVGQWRMTVMPTDFCADAAVIHGSVWRGWLLSLNCLALAASSSVCC
jgi:hypothetical protein